LKPFTIKTLIIAVVILASLVFLLPTFYNSWPHKKINLGLDLQGGMHLVLEVQDGKALEAEVERSIQEIRKQLRADKINHSGIVRLNDHSIQLKFDGQKNKTGFETVLSQYFSDLELVSSNLDEGADENKSDEAKYTFILKYPATAIAEIKKMAVQQALETIRNRIDEFGVNEPDIRVQSGNRIVLQLPGIQDPERAKKLIGKTAQLTFQLVNDEADLQTALKGSPPVGYQIMYQENQGTASELAPKTPYLIQKRILLDGSLLTHARVEFDQFNQPRIGIEFDRKGARIFERITGENINKRLAIILDNKVYSAPVIQDRIAGGKAVITGQFSLNDATDLAIALRAGALPAPVTIIEERTVGPSLGADSIRTGLISMLVGGLLVILFLPLYYKRAGLIADFSLIINILLIGAGLAAFQATLTLPGIAGIILTIGMAIDANVLIFERIRGELRIGKTALAAVHDGFDKTTLTIMDANITTLIAAVVLYQFGTGPVKGFAVTLSLGILASLFTALIISRVIFDFSLRNKTTKELSI
jgi:preprotein translocase subunit SecD